MQRRGCFERHMLSRGSAWPMRRRGPPRPWASASLQPQIFAKRDGAVVLLVVRAVDECHCAPSHEGHDRPPRLRLGVELSKVANAKLSPLRGIVTEPLPEFSRRCDLSDPAVQLQRVLRETARPQSLDEEACTIGRGHSVVGALQFDHCRLVNSRLANAIHFSTSSPETPSNQAAAPHSMHTRKSTCSQRPASGQ
jgi:hypothetical protein